MHTDFTDFRITACGTSRRGGDGLHRLLEQAETDFTGRDGSLAFGGLTRKGAKWAVDSFAQGGGTIGGVMEKHRIYTMAFARVYPLYINKAERKGRTKAEVDEIIRWLTGYTQKGLEAQLEKQSDFETFFAKAPKLNPARGLIKGVVCGIRVEEIEEPLMREIRYLDKLIDELAKGKAMEKILRRDPGAG